MKSKIRICRTIFTIVFFLISISFYSQVVEKTSLSDCWESAEKNHSMQKEKDLISLIHGLNLENISSAWLPKAEAFGLLTYQSDVITIDPGVSIPGLSFPSQQKDQYKLGIDFQQMIYDGGIIKARKNFETSSLKSEQLKIDVSIYQLKDRVSQLYFSVLIVRQNIEVMEIFHNELLQRIEVVKSGIQNGIVPESNLWQLDIERLNLEKKKLELNYSYKTLLDHLSEVTSLIFTPETELLLPDFQFTPENDIQRSEYDLFQQMKLSLSESGKILSSSRRPKLAAFAQTGYGRPGLNMLSDEFDTYYLVGLRLSWAITDWNVSKRSRQILEFQQDMVDVRQELFDQSLRISITKELLEIDRLKETLENNQKIIDLREKMLKVFSSRLDQGIIQPTDYISEFNALLEAKIKSGIHEIQLVQSLVNYYFQTGNTDKLQNLIN